ncbi:MAG: hypothetical protein HC895_19565 [Leptolyngbyaceae cyanobacterium SM1_3_5]|nr:hypothetical protein [Leptolyngbyaceae cyanobacterium SM1_3_5]
MRRHHPTLVGKHGVKLQKLNRRQREALPKGRRRRFDRTSHKLLTSFEHSGYFIGQIDLDNFAQADPL